MSIKMMAQVWDAQDLIQKQGELLVMLVLADYANDDGVCWPSIEQIARKSRMDQRSARRIVRRLEEQGHVVRAASVGRETNRYVIIPNPDRESGSTLTESPGRKTPNPDSEYTQPGLSIHSPPYPPYKDKPSKNHHNARESDLFNESENGEAIPSSQASWKDLFDQWWAIYPRKASRKKAEERFRAALKRVGFEALMQATRNYAAAVSAKGTEQQFIAHGSTWLHQERWEDWLSPQEEPSETMRMLKNMGYA